MSRRVWNIQSGVVAGTFETGQGEAIVNTLKKWDGRSSVQLTRDMQIVDDNALSKLANYQQAHLRPEGLIADSVAVGLIPLPRGRSGSCR